MAVAIDINKMVWEGWTVQDFIDELEPVLDMIQSGGSWQGPFVNRKDMAKWIKENQPYYKKRIPEVEDYFFRRYGI